MKRVVLVVALALTMLLLSVGSALAGPQPLPSAACNSGTLAHTQTERIPHQHDFDGDLLWACYHSNIHFPLHTPGDGLE